MRTSPLARQTDYLNRMKQPFVPAIDSSLQGGEQAVQVDAPEKNTESDVAATTTTTTTTSEPPKPLGFESAIKPSGTVVVAPATGKLNSVDVKPKEETTQPEYWQQMDWSVASKDPNYRAAEYISKNSKYRREQGLPDMSYAELSSILRPGEDPYTLAKEQKRQERRLRGAEMINTVGSFLVNLVNYARTRGGHASMDLSNAGKEGQERINKIREYRQKLADQKIESYMTARRLDDAEKSRQDTLASSKEAAVQKLAQWEAEFNLKIQNAKDDKERKAAMDEFNKWAKTLELQMKQQGLENTKAYQDVMARAAIIRANNGGQGNAVRESFTVGGNVYTRNSALSQQEARDIINAYGTDDQKKALQPKNSWDPKPDIVSVANEVMQSGRMPEREIIGHGFKKTTEEVNLFEGIGDGDNAGGTIASKIK